MINRDGTDTKMSEINLYNIPPLTGFTSHKETLQFCKERLVLFEIFKQAEKHPLFSNIWTKTVEQEIGKMTCSNCLALLKGNLKGDQLKEAQRIDVIAHWFLRLAFSENQEKMMYFINQELQWLYLRFKKLRLRKHEGFIRDNNLEILRVTHEEQLGLKQKLICSTTVEETKFQSTRFYKSCYINMGSLLRNRRVFPYKGYVYFPETKLFSCVKDQIGKKWYLEMTQMKPMIPHLTDDRIQDLLQQLPISLPTTETFLEFQDPINYSNIDQQANQLFPLCMRFLHERLREKHHLKYQSKMLLGIFLKTIGMPYEDFLSYWEDEFTQKMDQELYNKRYVYLFKHQYAKVGGRINYPPYGCAQIQDMTIGAMEHHGCPFKHWERDKLRERLGNEGCLNYKQIDDILKFVDDKMYSNACTQLFNYCFQTGNKLVKSPSQYYLQANSLEKNVSNLLDEIVCCTL